MLGPYGYQTLAGSVTGIPLLARAGGVANGIPIRNMRIVSDAVTGSFTCILVLSSANGQAALPEKSKAAS